MSNVLQILFKKDILFTLDNCAVVGGLPYAVHSLGRDIEDTAHYEKENDWEMRNNHDFCI